MNLLKRTLLRPRLVGLIQPAFCLKAVKKKKAQFVWQKAFRPTLLDFYKPKKLESKKLA